MVGNPRDCEAVEGLRWEMRQPINDEGDPGLLSLMEDTGGTRDPVVND